MTRKAQEKADLDPQKVMKNEKQVVYSQALWFENPRSAKFHVKN